MSADAPDRAHRGIRVDMFRMIDMAAFGTMFASSGTGHRDQKFYPVEILQIFVHFSPYSVQHPGQSAALREHSLAFCDSGSGKRDIRHRRGKIPEQI